MTEKALLSKKGASLFVIGLVVGLLSVGISQAMKVEVEGDLQVGGADIMDDGGTARITLTDNGSLTLREDGGSPALTVDTDGNVGVGTTSPGDELDVNGDIRVRGADIKDAGGIARITLTQGGSLSLKEDGGSAALTIDIAGKVGIGTTSPGDELDVNGDIRVRGADIRDAGGTARITLTDNGDLELKNDYETTILTLAGNSVGVGYFATSPGHRFEVYAGAGYQEDLVFLRNVATDQDYQGLGIQCGPINGADCSTLRAYDGDGDLHGGLEINTQTVQLWQRSDGRLKENISPAAGSLKVIKQLPVRLSDNYVCVRWG